MLEYMCDRDTGEKLPRDWAEGGQLGLLGQRPVLRSVIQRDACSPTQPTDPQLQDLCSRHVTISSLL